MTAFLLIAALLAAGAVLFVVPPLLSREGATRISRGMVNAAVYRDQLRELDADLRAGTLSSEHYDKARRELEARLLQDVSVPEAPAATPVRGRMAAIAAGAAVPVLAIGVYLTVGNPQGVSPDAVSARGPSHALDEQQILAMVEGLAARLKTNPNDAEGWAMLARSYGVVGRFSEAAQAYANAVARVPNNAPLLADYADALAMAQGRRLQGEPEKIIARALEVDPNNVKALALAGTVGFEKKDYASAVTHWQRILRVAPAESDLARSITASIAEAQALSGAGAAPPPRAQAVGASTVSGVVTLAPELASKVAPTDTVFIYARAADGPRAPLAVVRKPARELPAKFTLDDTMAMAPDMKLSSFSRVVVAARISKSGNAAPQPGDLQGASRAVPNSATGVTVVIDTEVH